jgi:hypothetical protein
MRVLKTLVGRLGGELGTASNSSGRGACVIVGPPKCSAMKSIPDRYFAEAAARDSVGVIAAVAGRGTGNDDGDLERRDDRGVG